MWRVIRWGGEGKVELDNQSCAGYVKFLYSGG